MPSDLQAIRFRRQRWIEVVNARDVDGYVDLLTEDVVWLPPGQPALGGRLAFEAWVRPFFERFSYAFTLTEPDVRLAGDWAFERGAFTSTMRSLDGGEPRQHSGRYMVLWRRDAGDEWRIERYIDET